MSQVPSFRDLRLGPAGTMPADIQFPLSWVDGVECVRQRIVVKLCTFLGEPLFDAEAGVPWFSWLGPKLGRASPEAIGVTIGQQVQEIPGVSTATATATESGRHLRIDLVVVLVDGTRATFQVGPAQGVSVPGAMNSYGWTVLLLGWSPATA